MTRYINTITLVNTTYRNKTILNSVNLADVPWEDNSMDQAFIGCTNLKSVININENVTDMNSAFHSCHNLNQTPVIQSGVTNLYETFYECYNLTTIPSIPSAVTNMVGTFGYCNNISIFPYIPYGVTNLHNTFHGCSKLDDTISIANNITDLSGTFSECSKLEYTPDLSNANSVTNMEETFLRCSNIKTSPNIPNGVTTMKSTFNGCSLLENTPDLSDLTSLLTMQSTFAECGKIEEPSIIPNTVTNIEKIYCNCISLKNMPTIPNSVVNMNSSFYNCNLISEVSDMSDAKLINNMNSTFYNCENIEGDIFIGSENIEDAINCFGGTTSNKNVYIPFENGSGYTSTYNAFNVIAHYPSDESDPRINGVLLRDINGWRYTTLTNNTKVLHEYLGKNTIIYPMEGNVMFDDVYYVVQNGQLYPPYKTTREANSPFYHNQNVVGAELEFKDWINNSVSYAFLNCTNLEFIHNFSPNITEWTGVCWGCPKLTDITLPASIYESSNGDLSNLFDGCTSLENIRIVYNGVPLVIGEPYPGIPTVTSMVDAFKDTPITKQEYIPNSVTNVDRTFSGTQIKNEVIVSNDGGIPLTTVSMVGTFENTLVSSVPLFPPSARNIAWAFANCYQLISVANFPTNVVNMQGTFYDDYNLESYTDIRSKDLEDMSYTFYNCSNVTEFKRVTSKKLTEMDYTYYNCSNMTSAPIVPPNVVNMQSSFDGCTKLSGDIFISSDKVEKAIDCFNNTTNIKNVYIPFMDNEGNYTSTYNAFNVVAGYPTDPSDTRVNGVLLIDIGNLDINLEEDWVYSINDENDVRLLAYIGDDADNLIVPKVRI